jgi:hypothetical protein
MNIVANFEHRASSSRGKHEGESSYALCDRLSRTRDNSQRQLPTDHDYAVPTREYQTDQSSLNLPRLLLALSSRKSKSNYKKHPHRLRRVDTVTPYQGLALFDPYSWSLNTGAFLITNLVRGRQVPSDQQFGVLRASRTDTGPTASTSRAIWQAR